MYVILEFVVLSPRELLCMFGTRQRGKNVRGKEKIKREKRE